MKARLLLPTLFAFALGPGCASAPPGGGRPVNVILIVTDDQGWADIGTQGAPGFETPNLDRLAREGARFTDFYVSQPVCSASRASILTGCYANRIGIAHALTPAAKHGIAASETTIAEVAKSRGYATAAFGKWHLGHLPPFLPTRHGFDSYWGLPYSNDMWPGHPESPKAWPDLPTYRDEHVVGLNEDQDQLTGKFTQGTIEFIRASARAGKPFFAYLAHPMPHVPLGISAEFRGRSSYGPYGDVIEEIDAGVGRILDVLDELGIADDTVLLFTSDNGPWTPYGNHAGTTGPLRESKGTTFEGGVRVPFLARWPGRIPAGLVCAEPAMTIDFLPTVAHWIGAPLPELEIDGRDISALLEGRPGARSPHEALFFWYESNQLQAVRCGRWKLHFPHTFRDMRGVTPGRDGKPARYPTGTTGTELYDLQTDIGELHDVAAENPDVVARLTALADGMRARLGDSLTKTKGSENRPAGQVDDGTP